MTAVIRIPRRPPVAASSIRVEEAMHRGVLVRSRDTPLTEIARLMAAYHVHAVVISDDPDDAAALWGIVSDLDLVAAASVRDLDEQVAGATAASPALMVAPGESLHRAAQLLTEHATTHLVVVDPQAARPIGVLSTLDVARALAGPG
jgi:CBS domain-containing protein